jgi:phosphoribosylglycinamide formyltransferase 1
VSVAIAVFASGGGSNFQSLVNHFATVRHASIALLICDRADAGALRRAEAAGLPARHIPMKDRPAAQVDEDILGTLQAHDIQFIALAGFLRLVPAAVTAAFHQRIVNIHPALLPAFGGPGMYGRHVHEAVLAAGCRVTGATVHWVDERYDEGRIIAQWPVPVLAGDTPELLAARVLRVEHRLYPAVLDALVHPLASTDAMARSGDSGSVQAAAADVFRLWSSIDGLEAEITAATGL